MNPYEQLLVELMNQYGQSVWDFVYTLTRQPQAADDISQDVFVKAYTHLESFRNESSHKTWLFSIARNLCKDYFRSAHFRRMKYTDALDAVDNRSPEEHVIQSSQSNEIWNAVLSMKDAYREVIVLHIREDLAFKDVGRVLGISESTARVRYHRAVQKLREILKEEMKLHELWGHT